MLTAVVRDLKFAARLMRKAPVVTSAIVLSLALAIGANTAVFTLLDAVVLRPLPVGEPEGLVLLTFSEAGAPAREIDYFSYPVFRSLREAGRPVVDLFGMAYQAPRRVVFEGDGETPGKLYAQWISGEALTLLGVRAVHGRTLTADDDRIPGAHPVAVISYSLWERRFGKDPGVLGRRLRMEGPEQHSYEIVGVLAKGFTGAEPGVVTDIWAPNMMWSARAIEDAEWSWFRILGRLKPGATAGQVTAALEPSFAEFRRGRGSARLHARPAASGPSLLRKSYARPLWVLMGVVGLLLLVACANTGNLLLARGADREREMALRISIGASRGRLIRQALAECALLSAVAASLGCAFAVIAAPLLVRMLDTQLYPVGVPIALNLRTLGALATLGTLATFLFGLIPALRGSTVNVHRRASRAGTSRWMLGAQVCCCCVILFLAGLFLASFRKLSREKLGFRSEGLYQIRVDAREAPRAEWRQLRHRVQEIPGVRSASAAGFGLFSGHGWMQSVRVAGRAADTGEVHFVAVAPGFLETMGITLLAGRELTEADLEEGVPMPAMVNEAFVRRYYDERAPVGRQFERVESGGRGETLHIVGVAADAKYDDVRGAAPPTVYVRFRGGEEGTLVVRTGLEPAALVALLSRELLRVHGGFRVAEVYSQARLVSDSLARDRALALLSALLAGVAAALAALGLYAVMRHAVVRRTKEIGIRLALGATRPGVAGLVLRDAVVVAAMGVGAGLAMGGGLSRFVSPLLFETRAADTASLSTPVLCLLGATVLAAAPAALRAVRVEPADSLRHE